MFIHCASDNTHVLFKDNTSLFRTLNYHISHIQIILELHWTLQHFKAYVIPLQTDTHHPPSCHLTLCHVGRRNQEIKILFEKINIPYFIQNQGQREDPLNTRSKIHRVNFQCCLSFPFFSVQFKTVIWQLAQNMSQPKQIRVCYCGNKMWLHNQRQLVDTCFAT